jgi:hypothetical protein
MKIEIPDDMISGLMAQELMWFHQYADCLTPQDLKAIEQVLSFYTTAEPYDKFMGQEGAHRATYG